MSRPTLNPSHAVCLNCKEYKPMAAMQRQKGGRFYYRKRCVECWSAMRSPYLKEWSEQNADYLKEYHAKKYERTKEVGRAVRKRYYDKWKKVVFDHYGHKCTCCGEREPRFLTIDHIDDDGAEHRKSVAAGSVLFKWLVNNNFPKNFRILCFNCNAGRFHNGGLCPHENNYKSQSDFVVNHPSYDIGI